MLFFQNRLMIIIKLILHYLYKNYLRTSFKEANIAEGIDFKNQIRIKNLPDPISIREAVSKIMLIICSTILLY